MLSVYIADDSLMLRSKLQDALEENDAVSVVGTSGDAGQAITEIRKLDPQVVIIDIRMPGGGGLPVLQDLKEQNPDRIAIILTSFPYPQYRETYLAAGADFIFDKTKDIPILINLVFDLAFKNDGTGDSRVN